MLGRFEICVTRYIFLEMLTHFLDNNSFKTCFFFPLILLNPKGHGVLGYLYFNRALYASDTFQDAKTMTINITPSYQY